MNSKGKLLTDFKFDDITFNEEKDGFDCEFSGEIEFSEDGWEEFDENGNILYEIDQYSKFIPCD